MTNYQTRLIALSIICSGIAAGGHCDIAAITYGLWSGLDAWLSKEF